MSLKMNHLPDLQDYHTNLGLLYKGQVRHLHPALSHEMKQLHNTFLVVPDLEKNLEKQLLAFKQDNPSEHLYLVVQQTRL